jgi:Tfp pilus assembly PilM family ATPase
VIGRPAVAIDVGRRHVQAVAGAVSRGRVRVRRAFTAELPGELEGAGPEAIGSWIGARLADERFPRARVTIAMSREHVGLKRITMPTVEVDELPDMTRLAMQREMPFDAGGAVIDFVPIGRDESSTTVLAVAIPDAAMAEASRLARAAGLAVERVSLRAMGGAALLREIDSADGEVPGGALVVDVGPEAVEFSVVVDGTIRFSRAAELSRSLGCDPASVAEAVVTETRRTWMSYRIVEDSNEVRRAVVLGEARLCSAAAEPIGQMLQVPTEVLVRHSQVETGDVDPGTTWPLAGLLLEGARGERTIDFSRPRKAPDLAARRRQRILAAAGFTVVGLLALFTVGRLHKEHLGDEAERLAAKRDAVLPERLRFKRDVLKAAHLEEWNGVRVNWLGHLERLAALAPSEEPVVLGRWAGTLEFGGVEWHRSAGWAAPMKVEILLEGEASNRAAADAIREELVRDELYRATSAGADGKGGRRLPYGFRYTLESARGDPDLPREVESQPGKAGGEARPVAQGHAAADGAGGGS